MQPLDWLVALLLLLGTVFAAITIYKEPPCTLVLDGASLTITGCKLTPELISQISGLSPLRGLSLQEF
ncbi:triple gene block 3 [Yam virus X]|uniref:Movement protein TGBp3 n=1 Tax=Yam virus X TaxID=1503864 RepID=A0A096XMC6_9VIRU|nr:triple gene block 3 [Yam virus X]AIB00372.1 triple gene block 3 [Yam virus X]